MRCAGFESGFSSTARRSGRRPAVPGGAGGATSKAQAEPGRLAKASANRLVLGVTCRIGSNQGQEPRRT